MTEIKNGNQQVAKRENKPVDFLKAALRAPSVIEQFQNALKENSNSFVASVIDLFNSDSGLQKCDPNRVIMEALKAATLKLPINKALGFAYIIPFNTSVKNDKGGWDKVMVPTFMPGYKGFIQMAMRTGQYKTINADVVYEGEIGRSDKLTGEIHFDGKKTGDKVIGYFAYFELLNGFSKTLYVELEDMAKHAKKYSASIKNEKSVTVKSLMELAGKDPSGLGWTGGFDNMALKTVLRNLLSKYGYLSVEMQTTIANDIVSDSESERDSVIETTDAQYVDLTNEPQDGQGSGDSGQPKEGKKEEDKPY